MKLEIPKLFKKKRHFRKGGFHTNPNIGWQILVLFAFTAVVLSFILGGSLFLSASRQFQVPTLPDETREKLVDRARLDKALGYFSERAEKSRATITSPSQVVDPSK